MTEHGSGNKYTYDAANQRLRKTENGDSTYYVTNGLEVLAEYDENDNLQAEHIYGLGRILAKFEPGVGHTFFYSDHLGSTRLVGGSSESSDDMRRDFYPYGEELTAAGNDDTPYTFTGKELDSATGLHYIVARYYDPTIGRWYVPDALSGRFLHLSPYVYADNNPVLFFDPNGLFPFSFHIRSFAPFERFGGGFKGDPRGFSTKEGASFRLSGFADIETETMSITRTGAGQTISEASFGRRAVSESSFAASFGPANNLMTYLYGNDDAVIPYMDTEMSPDIDVHSDITVRVSDGKNGNQILSFQGFLSGDKFPSAEAFVKDAKGNAVFLAVSPAGAGGTKGPYAMLWGDKKRPMANVFVRIVVDKNGIFQGVLQGNQIISIQEWNKRFEETNPRGE